MKAQARAVLLAAYCLIQEALSATSSSVLKDPTPDFFREHCIRCHDAAKTKGGLRLDLLDREFVSVATAERWDEILLRISAGEMPPEEEKRPSPQSLAAVSEWIHSRLAEGRSQRMAQRARVNLHRLSREEYALTVRDLLGVFFDSEAPGGLNEDTRWRGFNRIASLLTLSPSHVERYFEAAQKIIADAFPEKALETRRGRSDAANPRALELLKKHGVDLPPRHLLLPGKNFGSFEARDPGMYRIRVRLSALAAATGRLPHLAVWDDVLKREVDGKDLSVPEDQPEWITFTIPLPRGRFSLLHQGPGMFEAFTASATTGTPFTHSTDKRLVVPYSLQLFDARGGARIPLCLVDSMEWEGPLDAEADHAKRQVFLPGDESSAEVRAALERFLERAWRRPVSPADITAFESLVRKEQAAGEKFRNAYLSALVAALASKNFYYLQEGSPDADRPRLTAWELASRLSYFLWGSLPDEPLLELARSGRILEPRVLSEQVLRMLDDTKAGAFEEQFSGQWLQLHRVGAFPPDPELYPDYDRWLQKSMVEESRRFFGEVLKKNLPIREFLSADWTILNPRLALHYGLPYPGGEGFVRVALDARAHRGGVLTQAAVLTLTSDGIRHRPVHRGVFVSETIFGKTPPPPPPNVEPLEPTPAESPKATIRMQLAAHAQNMVCASCHARIDPLGFAFDNFDALGRWREREVVSSGTGEHPRVDASGRLPNGTSFDGPDAFKRALCTEESRFAEALAGQLATFAMRRVSTLDDQPSLAAIAARTRNGGFRLRDLVVELATSELFRSR